MLTMEWKIGEIKQINGEWYQCMKELGCDNCDLIGTKYCDHDKCSHLCRKDKTSVIFKKLEKIGEPYTHYCPSGRIIYFQRYKLFYKLYSHNTEYIMCDFNEDGIVSIEIKQNKEDMDDIRAWLKEAVQSQAELMLQKTFDDFDMDKFVRNHISTQMRYWTTEEVRRQVASLLADRLVILSTDTEKYNKV